MKKEDKNSMLVCFFLGIIFSVMAVFGVINGELLDVFHAGSKSNRMMITRGEHPLYFWLSITALCVFATLFLNSALNYWQSRHDNDDEKEE